MKRYLDKERTFNGKQYFGVDTYLLKKKAQSDAKKFKKQGYLVRIVYCEPTDSFDMFLRKQ